MSHKDAPPENYVQREVREWYTTRLAERNVTVGWGRDANGEYFSEYARDAYAAWDEAQLRMFGNGRQ